ncbi:MAG: glycerophosphodiester phosphodiesterase [Planctomycetales bacterium]|nr:glycerophosphodiester phosphodiesterase [Planctomycetales bacterium]
MFFVSCCWETVAMAQSPIVRPIVIAHRGASGYLPEHTLAAKALAFGQRADFLEQDVVITQDNQPIVLHDIHLDTVTDVVQRFPNRKRSDGRFYAIDFTLAEIQSLAVHERIDLKTGKAVFPHRFPTTPTSLRIPTLGEEIEFIQGLNRSSGRDVGIYPEIKAPAWHRREGKDATAIVLRTLEQYGYQDRTSNAYLQCFDFDECKRIRFELKSPLKLVQLLSHDDIDLSQTENQLKQIAAYADGIGPPLSLLAHLKDKTVTITNLVESANTCGLVVHPYTIRQDALPDFANDLQHLHEIVFRQAGAHGAFSDFPDLTVQFLQAK